MKQFTLIATLAIILYSCEHNSVDPETQNVWEAIEISSDATFSKIFFVDNNTGYLLGEPNYDSISFLETVKVLQDDFDYHEEHILTDTTHYSRKISYISPTQLASSLYRTDEGGSTWYAVCEYYFIYPRDIFFTDSDNGYILTSDNLYKTSDGGKNWNIVLYNVFYEGNGNYAPVYSPFKSIYFFNKDEGIVFSEDDGPQTDVAVRTQDGGKTWNIISSTQSENHFYYSAKKILPQGPRSCSLISLSSGTSFNTVDAGNTWESVDMFGDGLYDFDFLNDTFGAFLDDYGKLYTTTNGGDDWMKITSYDYAGTRFDKVFQINDTVIVLVGNCNVSPASISSDGGYTLTELKGIPEDHEINDAYFTENGVGFLTNNTGTIYRLEIE